MFFYGYLYYNGWFLDFSPKNWTLAFHCNMWRISNPLLPWNRIVSYNPVKDRPTQSNHDVTSLPLCLYTGLLIREYLYSEKLYVQVLWQRRHAIRESEFYPPPPPSFLKEDFTIKRGNSQKETFLVHRPTSQIWKKKWHGAPALW